mmetsp:Transcript_24318/g.34835  ORF Transcript_24318/g.34835 Transcript_24318/m.34835 type:complete len:567 (-) Transcript_24318:281-1981(-)|eukprot:CAMPEP_0201695018 /NCGR_PEP_ID=MMETSP0578-20130828/7097_1 /ASSEMBLY_ACC=CAM_ASM_000663 /TAXON_ID=267565 /ORGANISM="Skeletonema grethea, Strain CCMP 1804" /LENGTH=566 /DNA_ID=CAMNT_0048180791 /DNA_START=63 /DNA_END=1763 /DNA_ORIENTATION=+
MSENNADETAPPPAADDVTAAVENLELSPNGSTDFPNQPFLAEMHQKRSETHSKLRAYEAKRRTAYESKLQSSSLYWRAFRTLMHDSLLETQKADALLRGWTHASEVYEMNMRSVGEWCIDEKGVPVTDAKKKKKIFDAQEASAAVGGIGGGDGAKTFLAAAGYTTEEKCGSMIKSLSNSASNVANQYSDMIKTMNGEVLPELSSLLEQLKSEVVVMEKLGDSIMHELEMAEEEVRSAWLLYYNKAMDFCGSSPSDIKTKQAGARVGAPVDPNAVVLGCTDVWVDEMRYRMAVAFLSSIWEKCSSELSKLFLSMKDAECNRRNRIKELLIKATQRQERLWLGLPGAVNPILKDLIEWPMERKVVEDDVQSSIRARAQSIQRDEAEHKKADDSTVKAAGLTGVNLKDGNFELSSPLVSELMSKAKVIEKRGTGLMSTWKVTLAIVTEDSFLQIFDLPSSCKLHPGSAPEVAFQNLIPPVVVPSLEGIKGGVKIPSAKSWFDNLAPTESFVLSNCTVSIKDAAAKDPNTFELVEALSGKMMARTRKMQFRAVTREEAMDFVEALKKSK